MPTWSAPSYSKQLASAKTGAVQYVSGECLDSRSLSIEALRGCERWRQYD